MTNTHKHDPVRERIMESIKKGDTHMRPRWHFVLISILLGLAVLCTFAVLLYAASLSVFLLRESSIWFAPSFGVRGWLAFVRSIPLWHIGVITLFIFVLEALIRRYSLVYQRPLIGSLAAVASVIFLGGVVIGQTSFHREVATYVRSTPLELPYGTSSRVALPADFIEGVVVANEAGELVIETRVEAFEDEHPIAAAVVVATTTLRRVSAQSESAIVAVSRAPSSKKRSGAEDEKVATSTAVVLTAQPKTSGHLEKEGDEHLLKTRKRQTRVVVTPKTRLPRKQEFEIGTRVVVQGDKVDKSTIQATGVRDIDD